MDIPFKLLNKNDFPYLDDNNVGKPYGILYGAVSAIKLICVNTNEDSNNQNIISIYKLPELITNIGDAYVETDDVFKSAIIYKTDYENGLLYISNGRNSSGSSYDVKLVNCIGYLGFIYSYPRYILEHFFSAYAGIEYNDSNFDKMQWESELDHESVQAEIGFYLNDTNVDFWTQVYKISRMSKTLFRVDYTRDGKIYAKRIDLNRALRYVIPSCEIRNANTLEIKASREGVYSSILTKYWYNYYSDSWLSIRNNTYEKDVKRNYRKIEEFKDETYLLKLADAKERAYYLANIHAEKEKTIQLEIFKHYDIDLYDVITVSLMPDNLSESSRIFAGNRDCLVLSVNPKESELINYVNVQIIPDRVPLESQSAVLSDEFTTIEKEKSSSDIIYDTISDSVNTVAYSTRPLITLYTDVQGNVNSYDDAVGNIKTFSGEADVTGNAVYGIDFHDEGVTVDIQTGGAFSVTAVTNDISIVVFSSIYNGVKNKVNVTINKIIQGAVVIPNELFPDEVPELSAEAYQEYVEIDWSWSKTELRNTLGNFLLKISKNEGTDWEPVTTTATRFVYYFDRFIDKYPDKTETTANSPYPLSNWRFIIKAKNIYGNYSDAYYPSSLGATLNIDNYKKWTPTKPVVTVFADETGLDVEYVCDESTFFGTATYSLYVKGALKLSGIVGKKTRYIFDRATDGYPEKVSNGGDLDTWDIVIRVSTEGGSTDSDAAHPDVLNYLTWVTPKPTVTAIAGELGISYSYDLDESSYYGTSKTRKLVINSIVKKTGISMFDGQYKFDRDTDGYPEKSSERIAHGITEGIALDEWAIQIVAVSAEFTTGTISDIVYPDVTNYLTYIPHAPTVSGSCGHRDAAIVPIVGNQTYNHAGFRVQITRKGNAGITDDAGFYALGNSENAFIDETSYRSGSVGGYTFEAIASNNTIDQILPLINQSAKLAIATNYYYRIYTIVNVPTTASPTAINISAVSAEKLMTAKGTGNYDLIESAIETAHLSNDSVTGIKVADRTLYAENLAVVARNLINSFIDEADGTTGWTVNSGASFEVVDGYRTLRLTTTGGIGGDVYILSDEFIVNPSDLIKFSFGLSCPNYTSGSGLYLGLTYGQTFTKYGYDFTTKKWFFIDTTIDEYIINNFLSTDRKNFGTYILGSNVDISTVPAPDFTDETYIIYCLKLAQGDNVARIRTGFGGVTAGTYWRLFLPRATITDSSKIVAEKIVVEKLSSITTNPGTLQGDDAANYKLVMSPSASETDPEGTLLLGATTDASYFRRYRSGGIWLLDIKTATLKVDSISSTILGNFSVQTTGGVDRFIVNPDSYAGVYGLPLIVYGGSGGSGYNEGVRITNADNGFSVLSLGAAWSTSGWQAGQWGIIKTPSGDFYIRGPNLENTSAVDFLSIIKGGQVTISSILNVNGGYIYGPYGTIARSTDEWLRLNDEDTHTSGIYCGSAILRTDGEFQIGDNGSSAKITSAGIMTLAGDITTPGVSGLLRINNTLTFGSSGLQMRQAGDGSNAPISANASSLLLNHGNPVGYAQEISAMFSTDDVYFRRLNVGLYGSWKRFIFDGDSIASLYPTILGRTVHSRGCLVGGYDNIGESATKVSTIYALGTSYLPTDTTLENMYGLFYSNSNIWGVNSIAARAGWGLGIVQGGVINSLLTESGIWTSGDVYAAGNIYAASSVSGSYLTSRDGSFRIPELGSPSTDLGLAIGYNVSAAYNSIAIGKNAISVVSGLAIGNGANASYSGTVAVGGGVTASLYRPISVGAYLRVYSFDAFKSITIVYNTMNDEGYLITVGAYISICGVYGNYGVSKMLRSSANVIQFLDNANTVILAVAAGTLPETYIQNRLTFLLIL